MRKTGNLEEDDGGDEYKGQRQRREAERRSPIIISLSLSLIGTREGYETSCALNKHTLPDSSYVTHTTTFIVNG